MRSGYIIYLFVLMLATGCAKLPFLSSSGAETGEEGDSGRAETSSYSEDLSEYRPDIEMEPDSLHTVDAPEENPAINGNDSLERNVNEPVSVLIDSIALLRHQENEFDGYTIEIHSSTNRDAALEARGKLISLYPDTESALMFSQPFFTVTVGRFMSELQARGLLNKLKKDFPSAILIPKTFPITVEEEDDGR